jgi:hydrogenase maturation protease
MPVTGRTLVAGVGNIFQRDDAFGVEVVRLLAERSLPDGVEVADFGIRGVHLVYELLNGCDLFVLIDAAQRGYEPGTVTVLEVEPAEVAAGAPVMDAHDLTPDAIFAMLTSMGGHPGRSLVVACEPADLGAGMGLSDRVRAAVPHAVTAVEEILGQEQKEGGRNARQDSGGGGDSGGSRRGDRFAAGHQALSRDKGDVAGMEVVIGFAAGYWIGTRHGREGLQRALGTAREIWESPEARRMLGEGVSALQALAPVPDALRKGRRGTRATLIHGVIDEIIERRADHRPARAA